MDRTAGQPQSNQGWSDAGPSEGLYEREREWATLRDAIDIAYKGGGRLVVVEGPAGVGKTRLLEVARSTASSGGLRVLSARGTELERDFPFGVCLQLFEPALAGANRHERARLLSGAAALAKPLLSGASEQLGGAPGEEGHGLAHGLFWLACNMADCWGPLLLSVDDAHCCDAGSLGFLAHLALRLADVPIALIVASRSEVRRLAPALAALRSQASAGAVLAPAPLSPRAVESVVAGVFPDVQSEFAAACAQMSGGNPFVLDELLRSLRADGIEPTDASAAAIAELVPDAVLSGMLARLAALPPQAATLASSAAVLGDGASLRQAAALAELDTELAEAAADALVDVNVLRRGDPLAFAHPLIASALQRDLPELARARAHRRAAELIAADGAAAEAIAAHLLACRGQGDEWSVDILTQAARRSRASGDPAAAARLLARALAEPPEDARRPELLLALAYAETAAGMPEAPARMREALALITDHHHRANAHRARGRLLLARACYAEASEAFECAIAELAGGDRLVAELRADLLGAWFFLPGRRGEADPWLASLAEQACAGKVPGSPSLLAPLAATLACRGVQVELVAPLANAALDALAEREEVSHGVLSAFAIAALLYVDELAAAEQALELSLERARGHGSEVAYAIACHWRARVCFRAGRLGESVVFAHQALDLGRTGGWTAAILAEVEIERGEFEAAEEAIALVERADRDGIEHAFLLQARGRLAAARGDDTAALENLAAGGAHLLGRFGFDNPVMLGWRAPAVLAAIRIGHASRATSLADEANAFARRFGTAGAHGSALHAAALADGGEHQLELLDQAVATLERSPAVLERARALIDLGSARRRDGQKAAAREPLRRALELAHACGAAPLAERANEELLASGARPRRTATSGIASLTASELRVARLAVDHMTNKEIAQSLFVTTKTVESHLHHAFQKLNVSSRQELHAAFQSESPAASPLPHTRTRAA